jgi:hypothetical protein
MASLFVATIANLQMHRIRIVDTFPGWGLYRWHQGSAFESTTNSVVDTFGLSPCRLEISVLIIEND